MMSLLAEAELNGEKLTDEELMGFCLLLLIASIDTSQKAIGSMLWQLGTQPEARDRLAADPGLIPSAVEEFLRLWAPVQPMQATPSSLAVSCTTRELSEMRGPRTTTQPCSTSHR